MQSDGDYIKALEQEVDHLSRQLGDNYNWALAYVKAERQRQDDLWGEQNHRLDLWLAILGEEYGELCQAIGETVLPNRTKEYLGGYDNILRELVHVAAVSVAMMECLQRNRQLYQKEGKL